MAQLIWSWFICDGRYRVHAINGTGRRKARIIELEVVDTGERFHGSAKRMEKLVGKFADADFEARQPLIDARSERL